MVAFARYSQLIYGAVIGVLIFDTTLGLNDFVGGALILISGGTLLIKSRKKEELPK